MSCRNRHATHRKVNSPFDTCVCQCPPAWQRTLRKVAEALLGPGLVRRFWLSGLLRKGTRAHADAPQQLRNVFLLRRVRSFIHEAFASLAPTTFIVHSYPQKKHQAHKCFIARVWLALCSMSSATALSNRSNGSTHNGSSSSFQLAPAWMKSSGDASPSPAPAARQGNGPAANGHRPGPHNTSHVHLAGGGKPRNPNMYASAGAPPTDHYSQRPPVAGDFPSLDSSNRVRTAGQPASKKNWKEAALAVDLAAASKEPVPAQERDREREKEREKERLVNLVPKAPTPKKASKGGPQAKNPRDRDNRNKIVHEPPPPPKQHTRSESPVLSSSSTSGGGMVVLSMPKASRVRALCF